MRNKERGDRPKLVRLRLATEEEVNQRKQKALNKSGSAPNNPRLDALPNLLKTEGNNAYFRDREAAKHAVRESLPSQLPKPIVKAPAKREQVDLPYADAQFTHRKRTRQGTWDINGNGSAGGEISSSMFKATGPVSMNGKLGAEEEVDEKTVDAKGRKSRRLDYGNISPGSQTQYMEVGGSEVDISGSLTKKTRKVSINLGVQTGEGSVFQYQPTEARIEGGATFIVNDQFESSQTKGDLRRKRSDQSQVYAKRENKGFFKRLIGFIKGNNGYVVDEQSQESDEEKIRWGETIFSGKINHSISTSPNGSASENLPGFGKINIKGEANFAATGEFSTTDRYHEIGDKKTRRKSKKSSGRFGVKTKEGVTKGDSGFRVGENSSGSAWYNESFSQDSDGNKSSRKWQTQTVNRGLISGESTVFGQKASVGETLSLDYDVTNNQFNGIRRRPTSLLSGLIHAATGNKLKSHGNVYSDIDTPILEY